MALAEGERAVTPTLVGRIQTRLLLAFSAGVVWTAILTPFLPHPLGTQMGGGAAMGVMTRLMVVIPLPSTTGMDYRMAYETLGLMTGIGLLWEVLYQALQSTRIEGDWPPLLALLAGIPEGIVLWLALHVSGVTAGPIGLSSSVLPMYSIEFGSTWLVLWVSYLGPLRILLPRWRYEGFRVIAPARHSMTTGEPALPSPGRSHADRVEVP